MNSLKPPDERSILFITIDSCRYDTFMEAHAPNLKSVGEIHRALAPGNFTYSSHCAMFVGFNPGDPFKRKPFVNPKFAKIFRMKNAGSQSKGDDFLTLDGATIMQGLKRKGFVTIGSGAVGWFDDKTEAGKTLSRNFDHFFYSGSTYALEKQLKWIEGRLKSLGKPVFLFLNIGETHLPYYYNGASWSKELNHCIPFGDSNDAQECHIRQRACLEYVDARLAPLLNLFRGCTTLICADHGDCWGEDNLWGHGISHEKVLEVPLIFRIKSPEVQENKDKIPRGKQEKVETLSSDPILQDSRCIIVLGMHRSGTSAFTGMLNIHGVHLGKRLYDLIGEDNPRGYWEHKDILALHEKLLGMIHSSHDDISFLPEMWWNDIRIAPLKAEICQIIAEDFNGHEPWGIKDPRLCRLLPLWLLLLQELRIAPAFVHMVRNPLEVAASLKKRDHDKYSLNKALILWLHHNIEALQATRGYTRIVVLYDDLLKDWKKTFERVSSGLHVTWPRDRALIEKETAQFLDRRLKHHNLTTSDTLSTDDRAFLNETLYTLSMRLFEHFSNLSIEENNNFDEKFEDVNRAFCAYMNDHMNSNPFAQEYYNAKQHIMQQDKIVIALEE